MFTIEKCDFRGIKETARGTALVLRYRIAREASNHDEIQIEGDDTVYTPLHYGKAFRSYMGLSRACYLYVEEQ